METYAERGVPRVTHLDDADLLRGVLAHRVGGEWPPTPDCLDDDTVAALAEGALDADARSAVLPHLAACTRCRGSVASVARGLADPDVARELRAAEATGPGRLLRVARIALPLAAAAMVAVLVWPHGINETAPPAHRAPPITAAPAPAPTAPVGAVADARALRWDAVPGADRYRVMLFDAQGSVLYETELAGTSQALPDTVMLVPGRAYFWRVEARAGFDRWASSDLIEFVVVEGGRP
jgi:hypothetical protein